jgi:AcrR family transcriptional regulator
MTIDTGPAENAAEKPPAENTAEKPPAQKPLRADAARNRQALIDAAERLFALRGLSVTLDDIAVAAGVNVATAYRHFANKHELADAFIEQRIELALRIATDAAAAADPAAGLREFLSQTLELMVANRGLLDVFTPRLAAEALERLDERIDPALHALIDRCRAAGVIRGDVEPTDLRVILQMLGTLGDIPTDDRPLLLARYLELMLASLRPTGDRLPGHPPTPAQARAGVTGAAR